LTGAEGVWVRLGFPHDLLRADAVRDLVLSEQRGRILEP